MGKRGPAAEVISAELLGELTALCEAGATIGSAFQACGIIRKVGYDWLRMGREDKAAGLDTSHARFATVLDKISGNTLARVENALVSKALDGDVSAQKFYLQARSRKTWATTEHVDHTTGGKPLTSIDDADLDARIAALTRRGG